MFSRRAILFLCLTIVACGILYKDSYTTYFFQDDWFTLKISKAETFFDIVSFFIPRTDVIYYRPLGMQMPFFLLQWLFGLHPLPFHVLTYFTHSLNIVLVYVLIYLLAKNKNMALLVSFLYGTSIVHYTPFFWSATYAFVAGPTAFFSSFIFYLISIQNGKLSLYFSSITAFVLGICTNEMVIVLPVLLFMYQIAVFHHLRLNHLLPYVLIGALILWLRFFVFTPPLTGSYHLSLGSHVLNNLEGYLLWSMQWPEEMKAQLVNFYTVNPQFVLDFGWFYSVFIASLLTFILLFCILPFAFFLKSNMPQILFGGIWFLIGLLPVIFFPSHSFSYYLPISLVGLLYALVHMLFSKDQHTVSVLLLYILICTWLLTGFVSMAFNTKVHWAKSRADRSKALVENVKQKYPINQQPQYIYVRASSENKLALNDQDALQMIYDNNALQTMYTSEKTDDVSL